MRLEHHLVGGYVRYISPYIIIIIIIKRDAYPNLISSVRPFSPNGCFSVWEFSLEKECGFHWDESNSLENLTIHNK